MIINGLILFIPGAGVDSYFEYLVKASSLLNRPELLIMFNQGREAVDQYLRLDQFILDHPDHVLSG